MKTELLAPAKNIEIAKAAIDAGADAVYIGADAFGARQNAGNSLEDIEDLVNYAHKFYVKVMVTVNTIIKDSELGNVKQLIYSLYNIGVDSIIVQDMAILKWAIDGEIPPIPLHISTQCNNRTEEKVNFFNRIGLSRVVLARELSINQIKNIIDKNPEIEIECFAHGALCVSYSGQCYLSCYMGGRSANRGECAQPCRKKYSITDDKGNILIKDKHVLSLKDFNTTDFVEDLVKIGVKSFKIEGRLKDKDYVRNVVAYYRSLLDKFSDKTSSGKVYTEFTPNINKVFNRGFTSYFLDKREECFNFNTPKFIGERIGKIIKISSDGFSLKLNCGVVLNNQDGLCFDKVGELGCLINNVSGNRVVPNRKDILSKLKVGMSVYRNVDTAFDKLVQKTEIKRKIDVKIAVKYENDGLYIFVSDEDNNEVSLKVKETEKAQNPEKMKYNFIKSFSKTGDSDFEVKNIDINAELPFIPISVLNAYRRELFDLLMRERLTNYKREEQKPLRYVEYFEKEIDYRGNVYNSVAEEFYNSCGAKVKEYAFEYKKPEREIELMRTKHCIKYALDMCKSPKKLYLVADYGEKFKLGFDCRNCEMTVLKIVE